MRPKPGLFRKLFIIHLFLIGVIFAEPHLAYAENPEAAWTWDILVIPPDEGWDTDEGTAIRRTLLWHQANVIEQRNGVNGHDVNFVFLPPLTEDSARTYTPPITLSTVAVFSFASNPIDRFLLQNLRGNRIPLLLAGGENVFFYENDRPVPFVFALDLFRDYRARAFADYAKKTLPLETRMGVVGARFTLFEEREARISYSLLVDSGFMPMPFWITASARNVFSLLEQEIQAATSGVLISYIGGMATRELWVNMASRTSSYRIWFGGAPEDSFRSSRFMVFADQNMYLDTLGGFAQLRRDLWSTRAMAVRDEAASGRANALFIWLEKALNALPSDWSPRNREPLSQALARVQGVPFGSQVLDINQATHRPVRRTVRILEVRNRDFYVVDTFDVEGLVYTNQ